ncbi:MAG TPA: elongation factor P hydroxylase [Gammaproteobacteria bacterium]|nr:elongation factor P hydroxylase [Gammaproteobacteria bacterium]
MTANDEWEVDRVIRLFNDTFRRSHRTILVGGGEEPLYLPANHTSAWHRIVFTRDYVASAFHEIAHWCIAGARRRQLVDYGYWYRPDGRGAGEQVEFQRVERRPQAIEWAFSIAAGRPFRVSVDNLSGAPVDEEGFRRSVHGALLDFAGSGFPPRAARFIDVLARSYGRRFEIPSLPPRF